MGSIKRKENVHKGAVEDMTRYVYLINGKDIYGEGKNIYIRKYCNSA
jgi:hypothetical protein